MTVPDHAAYAALLADLPPKLRVHEVAKRFAVSSRLVLDALAEAGAAAKSPSSSIDATAARTALGTLLDSGRLVVPTTAPTGADSVDAVEAVVADVIAAVEPPAPAAAVETAAPAAPVVEPAPWAPLFTEPPAVPEPVVAAAPTKPARRRASRPAAAPDVVVPVTTTTTAIAPPAAPVAAAAPAARPVVAESTAPIAGTPSASVEVDDEELYADLPPRMRVHELAKRAGVSAKTLIALLTEQGVVAKSANSVLARAVAVDLLRSMTPIDDEQPALISADSVPADDDESGDPTAESAEASADDGRRNRRRRGRRGRNRTGDRPQGDDTEDDGDDDAVDGVDDDARIGDDAPVAEDAAEDTAAEGDDEDSTESDDEDDATGQADGTPSRSGRRRRRRGGRGSDRGAAENAGDDAEGGTTPATGSPVEETGDGESDENDTEDNDDPDGSGSSSSRRRRRRRRGASDESGRADDPADTVVHVRENREPRSAESEVQGVRGSTRLEAKRQRRRDSLQTRRRPQILTEAEFLARRESVHRVMAVRQRGDLTQVAVLEDNVLVEHFVSRAGSASMIGNVYIGRVQNVLPSMEAAFVDIGKGRNAVLYAGEVNWEAAGLAGKSRRIETALSSGDAVLVQVSKDPVGHKGARLTTQISLPGRFLVYVPAGGATGISRKLPDTERKRLKAILDRIVPDDAGVIIRTAAEGVSEEELARDVERLKAQWEQISAAAAKQTQGAQAKQLYSEPDTLIKVIRDLFNSDISELVIDGDDSEHGIWDSLSSYVEAVAPELAPRLHRFDGATDVFAAHRIDEQIAKALERKVFLPSGGSLVIDRTEAMTVVDVNTGKYTGSGGNLEETVTKNNLEAAEEVVRQLRLRDIGGIIVVDFIDMVLEANRELVLRRLTECLGRDRTRHQVAEVTSLGLVQMTRKKMGTGLVEAFSEPCAHCQGRGIVLRDVPVDPTAVELTEAPSSDRSGGRRGRPAGRTREPVVETEAVVPVVAPPRRDPRGPKPPEVGVGVVRPFDEAPANELSSSLLAELNGLGEFTAVGDGNPDNGAGPDTDVLAALLPDADQVAEPDETADADATDGGAPRRRRRGGRGRSRRERGADAASVDDVAGADDGVENPDGSGDLDDDGEGVSPDDAVLTEFDEPAVVDAGDPEVETEQLDLLPSLDVDRPEAAVADPADAISDTAIMDPFFGSDNGQAAAEIEPVEVESPDDDVSDEAVVAVEPVAEFSEPVAESPAPVERPKRRRSASRPAGPPQ